MTVASDFGFGDDIDALLNSILTDTVITPPAPKPAQIAEQRAVVQAVKEFAAEQLDPELYADAEMAERAVTPRSNDAFTDSEDTPLDRVPVPVFTDLEIADKIDIRNFATLVTLNTSRWHAKVKDKQASRDAATVAGADQAAFETRKRLLVGADDLLKRIHQCIDVARTAHYQYTLPWSMKGLEDHGKRYGSGRLLPNTLFMEYTTTMAKAKREMDDALDAFEPEYPNLIAKARLKLGTRFDAREYPNPASIRQHFDLSFEFQPIPEGDDFKGLAATQCEALADALNKRTRTMLQNAMAEAWERLNKVIAHAADRLSSPDKMFHYTLVENLRDTVKLLKHLNVTGDQRIESVRIYVEKNLTMHDVADIKKDDKLRKHLGSVAKLALQKMREAV